MHYSYTDLKKLNGRKCFTLTQNKPAFMYIDDDKVMIEYPSGNSRDIPRSMIEEALHILNIRGVLTLEDVHEHITGRQGPITDYWLFYENYQMFDTALHQEQFIAERFER